MPKTVSDPTGPIAVLVSGYEATRGGRTPQLRAADNRAMGRLAHALMSSAESWGVRQLSPLGGDSKRPSRVGLKRALGAAVAAPAPTVVIALSVDVVDTGERLALVAEHRWPDHPRDTTLSLGWVRAQLSKLDGAALILVVDVRNPDAPPTDMIARALDCGPADRVVAVVARSDGGPRRPWTALMAALTARGEGDGQRSLLEEAADRLAALSDGDGHAEVIWHSGTGAGREGGGDGDRGGPPSPTTTRESLRVITSPGDAARRGPTTRPRPAETPDLTGQTLPGRFLVERELARGAHGVVYVARQLSVDRPVAVKVLDLERGGRNYDVKHFEEEIRTLGRLDHPNLMRIYQADRTADGRLFFAMELIRGRTLEQVLAEEAPMAPDRAVGLTRQILGALHAAHLEGIIHSDVKPANIALQPPHDGSDVDERVILFDFGVARLTQPDQRDAAAEAIGASLGYMAPEQASEGLVDRRSDLFSAALILYEMLTGWRRRRLSDFVPPLTPAEVSDPVLLRVLRQALAFDASDRFQSARELVSALSGSTDEAVTEQLEDNPFRWLGAFTERDRWRFHGRVLATAQLADLVLYNPVVGLTSNGALGKTSLIRAGLLPRLGDLRVHTVYVSCRDQPAVDACAALTPGTRDLVEAVRAWRDAGGRERVVIVFDQLDAVLLDPERVDERRDLFDAIARCLDTWPDDVGFVLAQRTRALRVLGELRRRLVEAPPVMRLGPLTGRGAHEALVRPFEDRGVDLPRPLVRRMLAELQAAGAVQLPDQEDAVLPADLQLLGAFLYDARASRDAPAESHLDDAALDAVGDIATLPERFARTAIDRAVEAGASRESLREILPALIDERGLPTLRNDAELTDIHARYDRAHMAALERQRLVQHVVRGGRPGGWELINELAVPAVLRWAEDELGE